jgi:endonuclease YncB( thermonuclease family)
LEFYDGEEWPKQRQALRFVAIQLLQFNKILRFLPHRLGRLGKRLNQGMAPAMVRTVTTILLALSLPAQASEIFSGVPYVVDGDTIHIRETTIRLEGIDAPETDQLCLDARAHRFSCGIEARDHLIEHIADRQVECEAHGLDAYGRSLGICRIGSENLNAWMVREGWALAFVRYSDEYVEEQTSARNAHRGLWSGAFIAPWDWRHRNQRTVVLGAVTVPTTAQAELIAPASVDQARPTNCVIKGNVNRKGERIYFLPGQLDYAEVNMAKPGKRWFCSEEEAKAAGWRPAVR